MMKKLILNFASMALVLMFLVSCSENGLDLTSNPAVDYEEVLDLTTDDVDAEYDELDAEFLTTDNGLRGPCFTLVFPVTVVFPDSTEFTAASLDELKEALADWKANATPGEGRPHLKFPFEVETADGEIVTVENKEDLIALKKDCVRERKRQAIRKCFDLVYPVNIELPNGEVVEIDSKTEMKIFLHSWAHRNRGKDLRPKIQLPFQVTLEDGTVIDITSKDDLLQALEDCKG